MTANLEDLIKHCKEKRQIEEKKLDIDNDPRKPDFYYRMARVTLLEWFIIELENIELENISGYAS
ncbi:MAG: hypothetical protein ACXAEU_01585 [Candidatus Hodarchaeales archaeon]|jgi:hypothetical protein